MNWLGLTCIAVVIAPFMLYASFVIRDRLNAKRDQRILAKCQDITRLFEHRMNTNKILYRVYLQSYHGEGYPYDLFMIEYRGGQHVTDTIWLPVRKFLNTSDEQLLKILQQELEQPGEYTIPEWTEAIYDYILEQAMRRNKP